MSSSSHEFYFPEMKENEKSQIYNFEKLVAYVFHLEQFYKTKLQRDIPCFRDLAKGFKFLTLLGSTEGDKKKIVIQFYVWIRNELKHIKNIDDCRTYVLQFVDHKAREENINVEKEVDAEHITEFCHLLWKNIESERALRK